MADSFCTDGGERGEETVVCYEGVLWEDVVVRTWGGGRGFTERWEEKGRERSIPGGEYWGEVKL